MSFSINTNISSLQAQNYLTATQNFQTKTINEVTSGLRIVNSGDDAAGLAVANGYRSNEAVLTQGIQNANDGLSQLQIADGGVSNISNLLDRASTLATESASGTFTGNRTILNNEFQSVIGEINRQAQSIGLNQGGTFAKDLSVFIGGGQTSNGVSATANGTETLNLSSATVDAKSLGLEGVQATGNTSTDIGDGSTTSVQNILANSTNQASISNNTTNFYFTGPGFSDTAGNNTIKVAVNLSGVTNDDTLVTALNSAIQAAGAGASQQATAFQNANVTASIVTNATGQSQLAFSSGSTAFQVQGGDQVSTALLGSFSSGAVGNVANVTAAASSNFAAPAVDENVNLQIQGAGLTGTQGDISLAVASTDTLTTTVANINTQIAANSALAATGIQAVANGSKIDFVGHAGQSFTVATAGDTQNALGFGSFLSSGGLYPSSAGNFNYSSLTGTSAVTTSATQGVQISVNGGATVDLGVLTGGTTELAQINSLNTAIQSNASLRAAGISATNSGGKVELTSSSGADFRVNLYGGTGDAFGFGAGAAAAVGTSSGGVLDSGAPAVASKTQGIQIAITGGSSINLGVLTGGANETAQIASLNAAFAGNATLTADGFTAADDGGGNIQISTSGANFSLSTYGGTGDAFGFGYTAAVGGTASTASTTSSYAASDSIASSGAQSSDLYGFTPLTNTGDAQTLTLSATDANGNDHTLNVALTSSNAGTLDQALSTINSAIASSNDTTLGTIAAFKGGGVGASPEGIQFLSGGSTFKVSLGSSPTSASGGVVGLADAGVNGGAVFTSASNGAGSTANISNVSTATAAVTAIADAVNALGSAQAVIGQGENQFNYAINLAQSQLTNFTAADSDIRDANLATESGNLTQSQIQLQAGIAALAQANSAPQQLLKLLQ